MAINSGKSATTHFGRQMKKERLAHGWSLREFHARSGIDIGQASLIENGKRPPTEKVAAACDRVFPERRGWFTEYYEESKSWVPAGFRSWTEYEDKAVTLRDWTPSIMTGLLQTEDYARGLLETSPGATDEMITTRLRSRMERQRHVLYRDDPPRASFVVDELALYRLVGSAEIMAEQMRQLTEVSALPSVTMQILPAVAHPANASGFVVTDTAALCEHMRGAYVFTEPDTVSSLLRTFDTLRGECYRVSESAAIIKEMREQWECGGSPLTRTRTAGTASKSRRPTA
jgi:transcriptional regulator with XRE-family HTH domain